MPCTYLLKIDHAPAADIAAVMEMPSQASPDLPWTLERHETDTSRHIPFIDEFVSLVESKTEELKVLLGNTSAISIWVLYEYEQECNLEFRSCDMGKLAHHGISLCVSCWRKS